MSREPQRTLAQEIHLEGIGVHSGEAASLTFIPADPGSGSGEARVVRDTGWNRYASYCRVSNRDYDGPGSSYDNFGFRTVMHASQ